MPECYKLKEMQIKTPQTYSNWNYVNHMYRIPKAARSKMKLHTKD